MPGLTNVDESLSAAAPIDVQPPLSKQGKKRGRKPKNKVVVDGEPIASSPTSSNLVGSNRDDVVGSEPVVVKKRGRKPKGGKIILQSDVVVDEPAPVHKMVNIILHLKCFLSDFLNDDNYVDASNNTNTSLGYNVIRSYSATAPMQQHEHMNQMHPREFTQSSSGGCLGECPGGGSNERDSTWTADRLTELQFKLRHSSDIESGSSCFWCTCEFSTPSVYLPKFAHNGVYHVYGCFCSPACAVAHLMAEKLDGSVKFERYHIMSHMYSGIFQYNQTIKPAPNPHYTLAKFCGNMTIEQFRAVSESNQRLIVLERPMTRLLPEVHRDNDEFIINNTVIHQNTRIPATTSMFCI